MIFGAEQLRFEPTAGVEISYGSRLRGLSLDSSGANTRQIEKCNFKRIEKFETHEGCDCIRQTCEGFIKKLSSPLVTSVGK